jgi:formylmethanofuran dehydrogenase subunit C
VGSLGARTILEITMKSGEITMKSGEITMKSGEITMKSGEITILEIEIRGSIGHFILFSLCE